MNTASPNLAESNVVVVRWERIADELVELEPAAAAAPPNSAPLRMALGRGGTVRRKRLAFEFAQLLLLVQQLALGFGLRVELCCIDVVVHDRVVDEQVRLLPIHPDGFDELARQARRQ